MEEPKEKVEGKEETEEEVTRSRHLPTEDILQPAAVSTEGRGGGEEQ